MQENKDAAWYYPAPKSATENITRRVAVWHGVTVSASWGGGGGGGVGVFGGGG
jgi:uncharacterized protein (DUF427 family)